MQKTIMGNNSSSIENPCAEDIPAPGTMRKKRRLGRQRRHSEMTYNFVTGLRTIKSNPRIKIHAAVDHRISCETPSALRRSSGVIRPPVNQKSTPILGSRKKAPPMPLALKDEK
jgi:hypothetical protein